jgi:hypothetical protein
LNIFAFKEAQGKFIKEILLNASKKTLAKNRKNLYTSIFIQYTKFGNINEIA